MVALTLTTLRPSQFFFSKTSCALFLPSDTPLESEITGRSLNSCRWSGYRPGRQHKTSELFTKFCASYIAGTKKWSRMMYDKKWRDAERQFRLQWLLDWMLRILSVEIMDAVGFTAFLAGRSASARCCGGVVVPKHIKVYSANIKRAKSVQIGAIKMKSSGLRWKTVFEYSYSSAKRVSLQSPLFDGLEKVMTLRSVAFFIV